jgi:uncharacterized protein (DUF1800 family)
MHMAQESNPIYSLRRRSLLSSALGLTAGLTTGLAWQTAAMAQSGAATGEPDLLAQQWRAMSRVGYGPTPALVRELQAAASPRAWALRQLDLAFAASQAPLVLAKQRSAFNAALPSLFAGALREREARAKLKTKTVDGAGRAEDGLKRFDFSTPTAPEHFSRAMVQQSAAWRLHSASHPELEAPLLARMTEFWFNHLNVYVGKGAVRPFVGHYAAHVARAHALGKFEDLLLASAKHPAMLLYLDQARSVAASGRGPQGSTRGLNENYARELLELHTLGVDGGYTQNDVRELARVLTGWTVSQDDPSGFRFVSRQHDSGRKVVLGQAYPESMLAGGLREGEDAIRRLARHPKTAQRVCLRLAQFFVADQPAPALVQTLRQTFLNTQGDMRLVMRALLESVDFWHPDNRLFKTPMDYACSALAVVDAVNGEPDGRRWVLALGFLDNAGQPLHGWQTPDGYRFDAATWLVPEALTRRADFALSLAKQAEYADFLLPYMSAATRAAVAQERPAMRTGLLLASPDFMYK